MGEGSYNMYNVLIADDEPKICNLIVKFISWQEIGLKLAHIAFNGQDALSTIHEKQIDILITDIRMPGVDGLDLIRQAKQYNSEIEVIIISGYSQFQYAQQAIQYGVRQYLLKPINKNELNESLKKILEEKSKAQSGSNHKEASLAETHRSQRLKAGWIHDMVTGNASDDLAAKGSSQQADVNGVQKPDQINEAYGYSFRRGAFQCFAIRYVVRSFSDEKFANFEAVKDEFLQKMVTFLSNKLKAMCYDLCLTVEQDEVFGILNCKPEALNKIDDYLHFYSDMVQNDQGLFEDGRFNIGLSEVSEDSVSRLQFVHARAALDQNVLKPQQGVSSIFPERELQNERAVYQQFTEDTRQAIDLQDYEKIRQSIRKVQIHMIQDRVSGAAFYKVCMDLYHLFLLSFFFQKELPVANSEGELLFQKKLYLCGSSEEAIHLLTEECLRYMKMFLDQAEAERNRPIQTAKQYIQENYNRQVTLEDVSAITGFSPGYFSTLFHKETGETFVGYLTKIRIQHARELLKHSDMTIEQIANEIGIGDTKHFTKMFRKYTELKPSEYRKLYR